MYPYPRSCLFRVFARVSFRVFARLWSVRGAHPAPERSSGCQLATCTAPCPSFTPRNHTQQLAYVSPSAPPPLEWSQSRHGAPRETEGCACPFPWKGLVTRGWMICRWWAGAMAMLASMWNLCGMATPRVTAILRSTPTRAHFPLSAGYFLFRFASLISLGLAFLRFTLEYS